MKIPNPQLNRAQPTIPDSQEEMKNAQTSEERATEEAIKELRRELRQLKDAIEGLANQDAEKMKAFDTLYKCFEDGKAQRVFDLKRSLLSALIAIHRHAASCSRSEPEHASFEAICDAIEEALAMESVVKMEPQVGEPVDPARQRVIDSENTHDPGKQGHVARIVADGFSYGKIVLRHQDVIAFRLSASPSGL